MSEALYGLQDTGYRRQTAYPDTRENVVLDRRTFLGGVGLAAGAVVVGAMLPLSVANSSGPCIVQSADPDGLWSVDVICGHWPPYAHPISYGRPEVVNITANLQLADHLLELDYMLVA